MADYREIEQLEDLPLGSTLSFKLWNVDDEAKLQWGGFSKIVRRKDEVITQTWNASKIGDNKIVLLLSNSGQHKWSVDLRVNVSPPKGFRGAIENPFIHLTGVGDDNFQWPQREWIYKFRVVQMGQIG